MKIILSTILLFSFHNYYAQETIVKDSSRTPAINLEQQKSDEKELLEHQLIQQKKL